MTTENLDKIFQARSIAVVGASERKNSVDNALMRNIIECGFPGKIFQKNQHRQYTRR
jgi:acetyltransferase